MAFLASNIGLIFFNTHDRFSAILQAFGLFAISYLFRPLGSIVFGLIGDKYGTSTSLKISLITMTLPSVLIGFLPTFSSWGYLSAIVLILLRVIQGFGAGGELPNSAVYLYQNSEKKYFHTVYCSLIVISSISGVLLSSFTIFILQSIFSIEQINIWAWRIPFLIGIPMSLIILRIRDNINKSFIHKFETHNKILNNRVFLFNFVRGVALVACEQVGFYTVFIWLPTFLTNQQKFKTLYISAANNLSFLSLMIFTFISAYLCSKFNYKIILMVSSFIIAITTIPLFLLLIVTNNVLWVFIVLILFGLTIGFFEGVVFFALSKIFVGNRLNSGIAISFTFASVMFGGTSPLVCTYFTKLFNLDYFAAIYITFFAVNFIFIEYLSFKNKLIS